MKSLLNDSECITSELFHSSELSKDICNDTVDSESRSIQEKETDVPKSNFNLLEQFEVNIS